jgi:glycosyltransferase involved in cell wall biosynthesis
MTELTVIVLAYNEVNSLNETIKKLNSSLSGQDVKIVISTSLHATHECRKMAEDLEVKFKNVSIHIQVKPYVAPAVMEVAHQSNTKYIVYMSSDLETPPELVATMLEKAKSTGVDIVIASRWIQNSKFENYGKWKYLLSYSAQKLCKFVYPNGLTEFTYGFRLYKKAALCKYKYLETKHPFFLESLLVQLKFNMRICEIPVSWKARDEGKSLVKKITLLRYLVPIFRTKLLPKRFYKYRESL